MSKRWYNVAFQANAYYNDPDGTVIDGWCYWRLFAYVPGSIFGSSYRIWEGYSSPQPGDINPVGNVGLELRLEMYSYGNVLTEDCRGAITDFTLTAIE